ncbi:copper-binding protein [Herbaspirillum sp. ST 5-3]|nr:copper-binding protein [Herbaspirillum sp. ST 5-3]
MSQHDMPMHGSMGGMKSAEGATSMSSGEVKKIDKDAGKITIKHGPLANLGMPAMTMVFKVKDPAMLDQVKAGDEIGFVAEKVNGALTVTKLEPAK